MPCEEKEHSMKMSASVELVWQLAGQEAIAGGFKEIEPEHFLLGLLQLSELPVEDVEKMAPGAEVAKQLALEVTSIREELESRSVDSKRTRSELRRRLGKQNNVYDGGTVHRSQASRDSLDFAAKLADQTGSDTLMPIHLLKIMLSSPTPAMAQVLGSAAGAGGAVKHSKTPLLDQYGQDLVRLCVNGKSPAIKNREAECKVLLRELDRKDRELIFLISKNGDAARAVVTAATQAIVGKKVPRSLIGKRIVDVTSVNASTKGADQAMEQLANMLNEAKAVQDVILLVPTIESAEAKKSAIDWIALLKTALESHVCHLICPIAPDAHEKLMKAYPAWRQLVRAIWIQEQARGDIPDEI